MELIRQNVITENHRSRLFRRIRFTGVGQSNPAGVFCSLRIVAPLLNYYFVTTDEPSDVDTNCCATHEQRMCHVALLSVTGISFVGIVRLTPAEKICKS